MKNILLTLISLLYLPILWAQIPLIKVGEAQNCNATTTVAFTGENIQALEGYQLSVNWNPDLLTFENHSNEVGGSFSIFENEPGTLSVLWDNILNPLTVPNETVLFNLTFSTTATSCNFNAPIKIVDLSLIHI